MAAKALPAYEYQLLKLVLKLTAMAVLASASINRLTIKLLEVNENSGSFEDS